MLKKDQRDYLDIVTSIVIKIMLIIALFFPISTTMEGNKHPQYFQEFILVNAVAMMFIILYTITMFVHKRWNSDNKLFCIKFFLVLCLYIVFYYFMIDSIQWKWQGINCVISFGFFLFLMLGQNQNFFEQYHIIEFTNRCIVGSNIIGILLYLQGYACVYWYNFKVQLLLQKDRYWEKRFDWIYYHKSQYAFMILLSLAFVFVHRKKFINKLTFSFSVIVLVICLYISHVNTAIVGGGLIIISFCIDWFIRHRKQIKLWIKIIIIPTFCIGAGIAAIMMFQKIAVERSISTLGNRTAIWRSAINLILKRPMGLGLRFSFKKLHLVDSIMTQTNNGHNVFLNEMLRLSLPVGICFTIFFVLILVYALEKKISFFTIGIWGALLMSMMMDYAVMNSGWTLMLFFMYTIFFLNTRDDGKKVEYEKIKGCNG